MAGPGPDVDFSDDRDEPEDTDAVPAWFPGQHLPEDARRAGLDHRVPDGALLDFAGSLDPAKPLHRLTAWAMLAVICATVSMWVLRLLAGLV